MPIGRELIENAVTIMKKHPENYVHFFETLSSPVWIEPLYEHGFFQDPPENIKKEDPDGNSVTTSFPPWPESRYLARMAGAAPDSVLRIMLQLRATDNANVHWDFVEAACKMPACHAATWAMNEAKWVSEQDYLYMLLPDRLGKLVAHLAKGGEAQAAIALAGSLLTISPLHLVKSEDSDDWPDMSPRPRPKFEGYEYKHVLDTCKSSLIDSAGLKALCLFCDLLDNALEDSAPLWERRQLEFNSSFGIESEPSPRQPVEHSKIRKDHLDFKVELVGDDNSFISDVEDWLIASVRDAAVQLIEKEESSVERTLEILERYSWRIFHRISLFILRKYPGVAQELTADRLTDSSKFGLRFLPREYDLLLRDYFPNAPVQTKEAILAFIEQPVSVENVSDQVDKSDRTPLESQQQVNRWKIDRLSTIRLSLSPQWQRRYKELATQGGLEGYIPPDPGKVNIIEATTPGSPLSQEQIARMTVEEIVAFLQSWDSPSWQESPNSLGRNLTSEVAANPQRFAECATELKGLDATYVHAVLSGLREAVAKDQRIGWERVLELCKWVVEQPHEIPGRDPNGFDDHKDPHWGWSYKAVADLLQEGLERDESELPFEYQSEVWGIVAILAKDPEPTPEDEAKSHSRPEDGSISTVRGVAMHCVIAYALWVRRHLEQQESFEWSGFDHVPKVREVLECHLDLSNDSALAVRAVYGQYVPALDYLDRSWTSANLPSIFPHNKTDKKYWQVAWDSYIRFAKPDSKLFHKLEAEYRRAIERLGSISEEEGTDSWTLQRFAEELMLFYLHGELDLQDPDGLLSLFYARAPSTLRAKAHESVGRWLKNDKGPIEKEVIQRLQSLWANRLQAATKAEKTLSRQEELAAFGWWFASERFDAEWAIEKLIETLEAGKSLDDKKHVVELLATLAPNMPVPVARALHLVVESSGYLRVFLFEDEAKEVLQSLLASDNEEAREQAQSTIDCLLTLGHRGFRDLPMRKERKSQTIGEH